MSMFESNESTQRTHSDARSLLRSRIAVGSAILGAALFTGIGCNTTEGVGEDVEEVGEAIDNTAEDAERDL
jgi:predicted small secreted protein